MPSDSRLVQQARPLLSPRLLSVRCGNRLQHLVEAELLPKEGAKAAVLEGQGQRGEQAGEEIGAGQCARARVRQEQRGFSRRRGTSRPAEQPGKSSTCPCPSMAAAAADSAINFNWLSG